MNVLYYYEHSRLYVLYVQRKQFVKVTFNNIVDTINVISLPI